MKVLIAEPSQYSSEALELYAQFGEVVVGCENRVELLEILPSVDVFVARLGYQLDPEFFDHADRLSCIVTPTTGLTHIDLIRAKSDNVNVLSLKGEVEFLSTITPTAELAWTLLLALVRKLPSAFSEVLQGNWDRNSLQGEELYGKTLGLLGYGRLGRIVARYGVAFGMRVLTADPNPLQLESNVELVDHATLYRESDVLSVHVAFTKATAGMIDDEVFRLLKPSAVLINTSRGELIDESALLNALKKRRLAGAGLDVLSGERQDGYDWLKENALRQYARDHKNLIITPHVGGAAPTAMRRTELFMAQKFAKYINEG